MSDQKGRAPIVLDEYYLPTSSYLYKYHAFNVTLESQLWCPELGTAVQPNDRIVSLSISRQPLFDDHHPVWFHDWFQDQDKQWIAFSVGRLGSLYALRFPELADFLVDPDRASIDCWTLPDAPEDTIRHLVLDHVLPRYLAHQGHLVLHASAVMISDQACIAFLGNSGWGKSTLAGSFFSAGHELLTDDGLLVEEMGGKIVGAPAYAGSRLWQDSADSLFPDSLDFAPMTHNPDKKRLVLQGVGHVWSEIEVRALFCLTDPESAEGQERVEIRKLRGADSIMAMIKRAFILDVEDMEPVRRQFVSASRIAACTPSVYRIRFPREYGRLPEVRAAILAALQ